LAAATVLLGAVQQKFERDLHGVGVVAAPVALELEAVLLEQWLDGGIEVLLERRRPSGGLSLSSSYPL